MFSQVPAIVASQEHSVAILGGAIVVFLILLVVSRSIGQCVRPERTHDQKAVLHRWREHLGTLLNAQNGQCKQMWDQYLNEAVHDEE